MDEISEAARRASKLLGAPASEGKPGGTVVDGRWRDRPVVFEDVFGSPIIVVVPVRVTDLDLYVRRQRAYDERPIAAGDQIDVVVGDPAFDAAMLIDSAPADVVRMVFSSESLRARLLGHTEFASLRLRDGAIVLVVHACTYVEVEALLDLAVDLAVAAEEAHDLADQNAARGGIGSGAPYRGDRDHVALEASRTADIERRDALSRRKRRRDANVFAGALLLVGAVYVAMYWLAR